MCTVFQLVNKSQIIVGKNYDVPFSMGMIFTNQRGIQKAALILPPEQPAVWVSQYGSLTFSQTGKEFPVCGMNEAGLVVEQSTLLKTQYPAPDNRPVAGELQWIQYMLDTSSTVKEVLNHSKELRIAQAWGLLQYFVCDARGNAAVIEYLNGEQTVYTGAQLPIAVNANYPFAREVDYFEAKQETAGSFESLDRFARAAQMVSDLEDRSDCDPVEAAWNILDAVAFELTQWRIVWNIAERSVYFRTQQNESVRKIFLEQFDFSPEAAGKALDIHSGLQGDVGKDFVDYSTQVNRRLAESFFLNEQVIQIFQQRIPEEQLAFMAAYPETLQPIKV